MAARWALGNARESVGVLKHVVERSRAWSRSPATQLIDLPAYHRPRPLEVALTFDDGPHPEYTPQVLDILAARDATATFFLCGLAVEAYPELVKRIDAGGHTIGGHTWTHRSMVGLHEDEIAIEVDRTHELIERVTGNQVHLFRPPWGEKDAGLLDALDARSLTVVLWSVDSEDWRRGRTTQQIATRVGRRAFPGAIALLHDSKANAFGEGHLDLVGVDRSPTITALAAILRACDKKGLAVKAIAHPPNPDRPIA